MYKSSYREPAFRTPKDLLGFRTALGNGVSSGGQGRRAMKIIELKNSDQRDREAEGVGCSSDVSR